MSLWRFARGVPVAMAIGIIRLYRASVGAVLPPLCRFEPSCSRYAEVVIGKDGLLRGSARLTRRLLRCHPFHPGGLDPP